MTGQAARSRLVTQMIPDDYDPNATSPLVDGLFAHVPQTERTWLLSKLGYALRGQELHINCLIGETKGGKTTLLNAIKASLGDEYSDAMDDGALKPKRHSSSGLAPELLPFTTCRVITSSELTGNINTARIKALTGSDGVKARDLHEKFKGHSDGESVLVRGGQSG